MNDYVYLLYLQPPIYSVYRQGLNRFHQNVMDMGHIYYGMSK
jgi:hypothetical protein